jgi:hypothetical protein
MATTDAIYSVGETLVSILNTELASLGLSLNVSLETPDEIKNSPPESAVTVLLYQVGICGELRNVLGRTGQNGASRRPPLPLELHFMITPWVKDTGDSYRIIGAIARILYDHAILTFGELQGDGVWATDDTVEIMMESLPVEQHYDIWEPTELPYRLSLTYLARIIGIDSAVSTSAAPVAVASFTRVTP